MNPRLPQDVEREISMVSDGAVLFSGSNGAKYWLLSEEAIKIRNQVLEGLEEADRNELESWDAEEIKRLGREQIEKRRLD